MAVIKNLNTRQNPVATPGLTGTQSVKFIPGPRLYMKTLDVTPTPVTTKSNGTVPAGWTDLGIVNGPAKVTYTKTVKEVRTGMDEILRAEYIGKIVAGLECDLSQFDDLALAEVSGLSASQIVNGSTYQFLMGSEDVVQKAILLVLQNKLDGKEHSWYNSDAYLTFDIAEVSGELILKVKADLPAMTFGGVEPYWIHTVFA